MTCYYWKGVKYTEETGTKMSSIEECEMGTRCDRHRTKR